MAREAGAAAFINKPIDAESLLKIVGDLLNPGS
jgi:FixJ family two-component response regulator